MELWTAQSSPFRQLAISICCALVGAILMVGFRDFGPFGSNDMAGFLLGVLLLLIGVFGMLYSGRQSIVIDPIKRLITIEDKTSFGLKRRLIAFNDIQEIHIGFIGKKSNYVSSYYLELQLGNGEKYPLFAPGRFYAGSSDRPVVAGWKARLEGYLRM